MNNPYIESALLQGREILEVYLDGIGRSEIITSGIPTGQQVHYNSSNGRITFPMVPDDLTNIVVLYQDI